MQKLWSALKGAKTYVVAASGLLYAGVHFFYLGDISSKDAVELALGSAGLGALRHGLSTQITAIILALGPEVLDALKKQQAAIKSVALLAMLGAGVSLSACTITSSQQRAGIAGLDTGLAAAESGAFAYASLPRCGSVAATNVCSDQGIVDQMKAKDRVAYAAIRPSGQFPRP